MGLLQLFYNDFKERRWKKSFLLVFLVVQYIIWVILLTICSIDNQNQSGSNASPSSDSSSSSSSSPSSMVLLPYPLAIYAWSIAQSFTTLGILTPFSTLLTKKSWESFEYRFAAGSNDNEDNEDNDNDDDDNVVIVLPPMEIPILNIQYYIHNNQDIDDDADADAGVIRAKQYLESTYGKDWIERPLLLKGLWTKQELLEGNNENENNENNENERNNRRRYKRSRRLLTPNGLLTMTNLTIPYFTNATNPTALIPDGSDTVSNIIQGMIYDNQPYKIGSQYIVQNDPTLLFKEIIPNDNDNNQLFLTKLFGNHFSPEKITGKSIFEFKNGIKLKLPGTTTVPVFIANTITTTISKDTDIATTTTTTTQKKEECRSSSSSSSTLLSNTNENDDSSSCKNTDNSHKNDEQEDDDQEDEVPVPPITNPVLTGLHCEPIANLAVQLWGSRTWTLVNPIHSWKLRPRIASDGRSYYPSSISKKDLTRKIPRYRITTNPGDAVWLPTWTYHQVEYTTTTSKTKTKVNANDNDNDEDDDNDDEDEDEDDENENSKMISFSQLSIGASIFHFRPYDYIRRNPLFALLLIPSLLKELIGMKTQ